MEVNEDKYFKLKREHHRQQQAISKYKRLLVEKGTFAPIEVSECPAELEKVKTNYKALRADIKQFLGADKYRNFLIMRGE